MTELTAEEWYEDIKDDVDNPHFTKLTSTGISTDYQSIFDFAEAYYEARQEANGVTTRSETALNIDLFSKSFAEDWDSQEDDQWNKIEDNEVKN